jgi:hypothetical protein
VTFIGTHRSWRVAVNDENPTAAYDVEDWLEWSDPEPCDSNQSVRARAVIEVLRFDGGKRQRALAGGEIRLNGQNARCVRVGQAPGLTLGSATTCRSELAQALVPGLPRDFAPATLNGIVEVPAERPAGFSIVVDRAGYDEVDSSEIAFEFAGGLLLVTLLMRLRGSDLNTSTLEHVCSEGS